MENTSDSFMPGSLLFCMKSKKSVCYSVADNNKGKKYFIVEDDGMYQKIDIDEILYFSIIRRGCEIHILQNGTGKILRTRKRIREIEEELRREYFCRIHKSFLVNPRYITEVKKSEIKMDNNEILSVSKARRKTFEDMFAEYLSYRK